MPWHQARDAERSHSVGLEGEGRLLPRRQSCSRVLSCRAGEQGLACSIIGDDGARVVEGAFVAASDGHGPTLWSIDFEIPTRVAVEVEAAVGTVVACDEGEADGLGGGI